MNASAGKETFRLTVSLDDIKHYLWWLKYCKVSYLPMFRIVGSMLVIDFGHLFNIANVAWPNGDAYYGLLQRQTIE